MYTLKTILEILFLFKHIFLIHSMNCGRTKVCTQKRTSKVTNAQILSLITSVPLTLGTSYLKRKESLHFVPKTLRYE